MLQKKSVSKYSLLNINQNGPKFMATATAMKIIWTTNIRKKNGVKNFHQRSRGTLAILQMTGSRVVGQKMLEKPSPY